jgi:hypothetical protein
LDDLNGRKKIMKELDSLILPEEDPEKVAEKYTPEGFTV